VQKVDGADPRFGNAVEAPKVEWDDTVSGGGVHACRGFENVIDFLLRELVFRHCLFPSAAFTLRAGRS
jgi:hypothetical protein